MVSLIGILAGMLIPSLTLAQLVFEPALQGQINFPDTPVGQSSDRAFRAIDRGNGPWTVRFNIANQSFQGVPAQFQVPQGGEFPFVIRFTPQAAMEYRVMTTVTFTNGEIIGRTQITLIGHGVEAEDADIELSLDEIELWAAWDWIETEVELSISNVGDGDLEVDLEPGANWLSVEPAQLNIEPDEMAAVTVSVPDWEQMEPDIYETILNITSNDPDEEAIEMPVIFDRWFFPYYFLPWDALPEANHAFWVEEAVIDGESLDNWDEVGILTPRGVLAGSGWLEQDEWPILAFAYGENEETGFLGFRPGDSFTFFLYDRDSETEYVARPEYIEGPETWEEDGFTVVNLTALGQAAEQVIPLELGWSLISTRIQMDNDDVEAVLGDIRDNIILFKDGQGRFFHPGIPFNNIPFWNPADGYQIKMRAADTLTINGIAISLDTQIELEPGWNMIAYWPDRELRIYDAMRDFWNRLANLEIVKNGAGQFYMPRFNFDRDWPVRPGDGLMMKIRAENNIQFRYILDEEIAGGRGEILQEPRHFPSPVRTDNNMSIVFQSLGGIEVIEGAELACITPRDEVAGVTVLDGDAPYGMAVWGDDPTTEEEIENFQEGEALQFLYWDPDSDWELECSFDVVDGDGVYIPNGIAVYDLQVSITDDGRAFTPRRFNLFEPYPNPFNATTYFAFDIPTGTMATIALYNLRSERVAMLVDGFVSSGRHLVELKANRLPSGVYFVKLTSDKFTAVRKVALVR